ncbi:S1 family peptidase [Desulfonema magnum]|nr:serine protease [Desulfonema magnum]
MDIKKISENCSKTVVLIKTDKGTGTGFFINAYGTIATCYHVIQNANAINVRWKNRLTHAEVIYIEKKHDQALLNIFEKNTPYVQIQKHIAERVSDKQLVDPSDAVVVMGYPFASEKVKISNGKINDIYYKYEGNLPLSGVLENVTYKTDLVLHPGNSGSPVFDTYGIVIGMASAKVDTSKISSLSPKQEKDKKVSGMSFINSLDKLLSQNRLLFQANFEKKKTVLYKELEACLEHTNPYYFRYSDCFSDTSGSFYYECPHKSCGMAEYNDIFSGSFFDIPLYDSCKPTIIPRHFLPHPHSEKLYLFLQKIASNAELKKFITDRGLTLKND